MLQRLQTVNWKARGKEKVQLYFSKIEIWDIWSPQAQYIRRPTQCSSNNTKAIRVRKWQNSTITLFSMSQTQNLE